ncbi:MAG: radical SAM family heme chaperone HemW [Clostridia bacterium]|nr:radical SAM family heme chaperone HemW [Clostridia bacterium]
MMERIGIYVHVPFCRRKCGYCDFYSLAGADERTMDDYLSALIKHVQYYFKAQNSYVADTVYIGGGTPSVFGAKRLDKLLKNLRTCVPLDRGAEVTVELNPESVDKRLLVTLQKAGVNRLSLGVQSSDNVQLAFIGRLHDFEQARSAVQLCRDYCTDNISLDLMYGLPGQTAESWRRSLSDITALEPKHISCYALKREENTPARTWADIPDDDAQADMYLSAVEQLAGCGYRQYEISNFAVPGYESRHNMRYWDLRYYIGFGCAAHSYFGGKRFNFTADIKQYTEAILSGKGDVAEDAEETEYDNRAGEYIMLKMRTASGIDADRFFSEFDVDFAPAARVLEKYVSGGYAKHDGSVYSLTPKGFLVSNQIIGEMLDSFLNI